MSTPTKEQQTAIDTRGKNIIVSAGAGSGKTFVLKERVLKEVTNETTVDKLIILTFTKNAAAEMKGRIRKIISEHEEVKDQASLVDSAYITTFDSFANSLVKKYNYLLDMDKNFGLIDANIVNTELNHILDQIFLDYYKEKSDDFVNMINNYCYKNDDTLKENIIKIYRDSSRIINKKEYLDTYLDKNFSESYVNELLDKYVDMLFNKRDSLTSLYDDLLHVSLNEKCVEENTKHINAVMNASSYEELQEAFNTTSVARNAKGRYDDDSKVIRDKISSIEKDIISGLKYELKELKNQYMSTKTSAKVIVDIIKKLDQEITKFKNEHNSYEFIDISLKAIELVRDHEDVRNEIKNNTYEIMIDEYQDTDDIQETFISYIQNNNVYMVGDVKQSIYRFRNANPYIFKNKYDNYDSVDNKDALGYRIDLTANFRSRGEVINNINDLFNIIMTDKVGGANYKKMHNMIHGNKTYDDHEMKDYNYNMEILSYSNPDKEYSNNEVEAFIMADDILKRLKNKEQVMDEDGTLRNATYKDFCILIDKSKNFDLIKKIFEYKGIPTTIYKDVSIKDDDEIYILKNLVTLLIKIKNHTLDVDFKHAYMSIGRSYIYKISDQELFNIFTNNTFEDTALYKKISELTNRCDSLSNKEILTMLIDEFDIINKLVTVGDIDERSTKLEYFITTGDSLNKFGMNIYSMNDYFEETLKSDEDITMSGKNDAGNAVKIMTIHGSKGLEFAYVYSPYLASNFTPSKKSDEFYSNKYGIVLPYNDGMLDSTFVSKLYENDEKLETVSEKLRLFYVNITRAKEKFIMINEFKDKDTAIEYTNEDDILNSTSYANILGMLKNRLNKYIKEVKLEDLNISRDYLNIKEYNYKLATTKVNDKINVKNLVINKKLLENKHFSKSLTKVMDKELKERLDFGTYMHYVFEVYDFKNNNLDELDITDKAKEKINNFLRHEETKNIKNGITYKEHEIRFNKDGATFHGFIDLLVEYEDHFDIIDYKLSNVDSEEYVIQLNGYKDYIESRYKKPTNIYLYSINKDIFKKL